MIGICPTGALLSSDFLYKSRVWFLEPVRSACTGCARACSVQVWRRMKLREPRLPGGAKKNEAYRITALDNPAINGPWLCNKGFDLHKQALRERQMQPLLAGRPASAEQALAEARRLLAQARNPAVLVSAQASNEELDALKAQLGQRLRAYGRRDVAPAAGEVLEDRLLIRADKNPNSHGVAARFGTDGFKTEAGHDLVVVWGEYPGRADLGAARVIHLAHYGAAWVPPADVLIPISTTFERSGSFSNFEGTESRFDAVFDKPAAVMHAADVFKGLAA